MTGRRLFWALPCALLFATWPARADESADLAGILNQSVVTTASQTAETASTAPATSTSISAEDLRRYGIHTVEEAINFLALGVSTGGARSTVPNSDLGARGVLLTGDSGNHFLYLVDGHAMNEPFFGGARIDHTSGIPLEAVDRIEVIVGPGSVLYGSNAMLGVINIITKDAETMRGVHAGAETELPVWRRASVSTGLPFRLFGQRAGLTFAAQYWDEYGPDFDLGPQNLGIDAITGRPARTRRNGPEDGIWGGTAEHSTFSRVPSGLLRLRVGDLELGLRGRIAEWGVPFGTADFDDGESFARERHASADLKYRALLSPELELVTRVYADTYDFQDYLHTSRASACLFPGVATCSFEGKVASRWAGFEVQAHYGWLEDGSLTTLLGFDGRRRFAGSKQDIVDYDTGTLQMDSTGLVDETDETFGAYLQQVWTPVSELGLNAGARLDRDPRFDPVISPRAAASLGIWNGGTLKAIYAEAFRAPTFQESELGSLVRARADELEPERVRSVEASFEQRFGSHRLLFGGFRSWWKNLIQNRFLSYEQAILAAERGQLDAALPGVAYSQFQNAASVDSYGFNAALDGTFLDRRLHYGLNVTEAYSRASDGESGSKELPVAPRLSANARLAYDLGAKLPTLALAGYLLSSRPSNAVDAGFRPAPYAPAQLDLRVTATGAVPGVGGLRYRLSLDRTFGDRGPYAIGPVLVPTPTQPSAELVPVPAFRAAIGLEYSFWDE